MVAPSVVAVPPLFGVPTLEIVRISPSSGKVESFTSTSSKLLVLSSVTENESEFAVGTLLSCNSSNVTPVNVEDVGADIRDVVVVVSGNVGSDPVIDSVTGADIRDVVVVVSGNVGSDPVIDTVTGPDIRNVSLEPMVPVGINSLKLFEVSVVLVGEMVELKNV